MTAKTGNELDEYVHERDYVGLVDEREEWRMELLRGDFQQPHILQEYRKNRESDLWRATRQVEKLCEYILFLESKNG